MSIVSWQLAIGIIMLSVWWLAGGTAVATAQANTRIVTPDGPYTSIAAALEAAQPGDTIEVHGGVHPALTVDKTVNLIGVDWPVIDGQGKGAVVVITAPDVHFEGFVVRGSGNEPDRNHAGITIAAPHALVAHNRLEDVLFGIYVAEGENTVVRGNDITGKTQYDVGRKGDGIRIWYSPGVIVEQNVVHDTRDVVVWYSPGVVIRDNVIRDGRYGVHLMYTDNVLITHNQMLNNSVGAYAMYADDVTISDNLITGQRGPSGYALGFKDASNVLVNNNVLVDNGGAIFLDGTPFDPQSYGRFENNIIAFNDVGVILQPAVKGNDFSGNTFWENVSQMALQGGGTPGANNWQSNFWSDYNGFDADGDGLGDTAYTSERFFENLTDREPRLRLLAYSPAAQAIEFAGQSFPIIRPQPKLSDPTPLVEPGVIPVFATPPAPSIWPLLGTAVALILLGLFCGGLAYWGIPTRHNQPKSPPTEVIPMTTSASLNVGQAAPANLRVAHVSKQYGKVHALQNVSFTAQTGEAIALWGVNGAGKTTLLKAILGLISFDGQIEVNGRDVRRNGKNARRHIGYVPQEAVFYDWSVTATMQFYARLKKADPARIPLLLEQLGLAEHSAKAVPALSGGLKQRLALAIALLAEPPVLLLDEPTASLDAQARRDYLQLLTGLRQAGKTIVFASHRLEEVEALASRVLLLEQGQLAATLPANALRAHFAPEVEMAVWVAEGVRPFALAHLQEIGLNAHLNGRGSIVTRVQNGQKMNLIQTLNEQGIQVMDFEIEQ
ncbi:MAG TPA: nitrous oxide reductase family maturation protein NosD [Chloroflexota bacterium]|nr:nitrous oxide reductase family maturation protein NosD [Chloroflexota bacterium]